jgi:probable F420-dependent oxidoreductase
MRFGVSLPTTGHLASPSFIRRVAVSCERFGYDTLWINDHITWTASNASGHDPASAGRADDGAPPLCYDPLTTLSLLAGATDRIRLGTCVLVLPVRSPVVTAKEVATLDSLSGGRVVLGVGVGGTIYADAEFAAVGAAHLRASRGRVTDEWIEIMRCVWTQPTCTHRGEFLDVRDASVFPKPVQPHGPPVLIGGDSPAALRRVARLGDGSIVSRLAPDDVRGRRDELAQLAARAGRADAHFELVALQWLSIADDERTAVDHAAKALSGTTRGGRPVLGSVPHFVGAAARLQDLAKAYSDAGVDEVILQVIGSSENEVSDSIEQFATEVLDVIGLEHTDAFDRA